MIPGGFHLSSSRLLRVLVGILAEKVCIVGQFQSQTEHQVIIKVLLHLLVWLQKPCTPHEGGPSMSNERWAVGRIPRMSLWTR